MAAKNNIRSIRFSDELAELIDRQQGDTFTQKFENLITKCVWELPEKEEELQQIEDRIQTKREQLRELSTQAGQLSMTMENLALKIRQLEASIDQQTKQWDI